MDEYSHLERVPCDILLKIAISIDPQDYLSLSEASKRINECLSYGKYNATEEIRNSKNLRETIKNILKKMVEDVKKNPELIKDIKNPPEKVQLAAVSKGRYIIEHIKNPSEKVQLAAVSENGHAIGYIKSPSEKVRLASKESLRKISEQVRNMKF